MSESPLVISVHLCSFLFVSVRFCSLLLSFLATTLFCTFAPDFDISDLCTCLFVFYIHISNRTALCTLKSYIFLLYSTIQYLFSRNFLSSTPSVHCLSHLSLLHFILFHTFLISLLPFFRFSFTHTLSIRKHTYIDHHNRHSRSIPTLNQQVSQCHNISLA